MIVYLISFTLYSIVIYLYLHLRWKKYWGSSQLTDDYPCFPVWAALLLGIIFLIPIANLVFAILLFVILMAYLIADDRATIKMGSFLGKDLNKIKNNERNN